MKLRDELIYECSNISGGVVLILCLFGRVIVLSSPIGHMTYLAVDSLLYKHCQIHVLSYGVGLRSNQKVVGYFHINSATVVLVCVTCQASLYCS